MRPYRILVTGSREWGDLPSVARELAALRRRVDAGREIVVVHGAAKGLDVTADFAATSLHMTTEPHPADWATHGKGAGPIRNQAMVDLGADVCLAFPTKSSVGTWDCVRRANAAGIRVIIVPERAHAGG
ncbi:MAG TPA: SLOG family protein [Gemmatimonadales bacterium]|nr:SLOG family protein [Gemmatimonadales bacterium]